MPEHKVFDWSSVFHVLPALSVPSNGAINGYGFRAEVTGDSCGASVGVGNDKMTAPSGERVCVFSLDYSSIYEPVDLTARSDTVSGEILVGSSRIGFPLTQIDQSGNTDYAVDVPAGESATLRLSAAGYSQSFSLTAANPVGPRPAVLYEPPSRRVLGGLIHRRVVLDERAGKTTSSVVIEVSSASLGWFLPGDPRVHPARTTEAFLSLTFSEVDRTGPSGARFDNFLPEPGSAVRLVTRSGSATAVAVRNQTLGLFGSTYAFTVPADLSSGRLMLDPLPATGWEHRGATNTPGVLVHFRQAGASFGGFVVPPSPAAGNKRSSTANSTAPVPAAAAGGGGGLLVIVVPLVIFWRRRKKGENLVVEFPATKPLETAGSTTPVEAEPDQPSGLARLVIRVLGPVQVEGLGAVPRRPALAELCTYLALNSSREVPASELRRVLGTAEADLNPSTLYAYVSKLRQALGTKALVSVGKAGYRLAGEVFCDATTFEQLAGNRSSPTRTQDLQAALKLVRGAPFAEAPRGRFEWAFSSESRNYAAELTVSIERAANELCSVLLEEGRDDEAYDAAVAGLKGAPASHDLLAGRLRSLRRRPAQLEAAWRDTLEQLGSNEELERLYEELADRAAR